MKKIAVVGLGQVGAVTAVGLARNGGNLVVGYDTDTRKVDAIQRGESPIFHGYPGFDSALCGVWEADRLQATYTLAEAVEGAAAALVCVPTPEARETGALDASQAATAVAQVLHAGCRTVVLRSTVTPEVACELAAYVEREGGTFCVNPEFMREYWGLEDFEAAREVVVGVSPESWQAAGLLMHSMYMGMPVHMMSIPCACMLKYASNAFHATKVAFANEVARVCVATNASPEVVMRALAADDRLNASPAYLEPGSAYGGACLPKDVNALLAFAHKAGVRMPQLLGTRASNKDQEEAG